MHDEKKDRCYEITYGKDGKKVWEKIGWASEGYFARLAAQIRADKIHAIRHCEASPKQETKAPYFREVAKEYIEWAEVNKCRSGRDDKNMYKNHLAPAFDNKRLNEISPLDLERLKSNLIKKEYAPATVKHCLALFRQIFNKALLWELYAGKNPMKNIKLPTPQNQRERFLTFEEANLLLNELKLEQGNHDCREKEDPSVHDMALLSLHCGLRAGEIFNLKGHDLDFDNKLINISDPKNRESRKAYMTEAVKEALSKRVPKSANLSGQL
jgi:integrase